MASTFAVLSVVVALIFAVAFVAFFGFVAWCLVKIFRELFGG